jgi:hypothetical protein
MDSHRRFDHTPRMRIVLILGLALVLAACSGDPRSYGITGPGPQLAPAPVAEPTGQDINTVPGVPTSGSYYGPSTGPTSGSTGFWGYN